MTDQTTSEPVAYALYEKAGKRRGEWVLFTHAVSARDRSVYDVRPLYAHPEPSEAADELEAMRIERDNWRMTAEEAMRAEKRWKDRAVEAERERDRLDEAFDRDLPWRYDEVEAQRNQLAAVIEKVRAARAKHPACEKHPDGDPISCGWKGAVLDIDAALATAPADALRELKAAAWGEGHDAGWEDRHQDALAGWMPSDPYESEAVNPYRAREGGRTMADDYTPSDAEVEAAGEAIWGRGWRVPKEVVRTALIAAQEVQDRGN